MRGGKRDGAGRPVGTATTVVRLPIPVAAIARRLAAGTLKAGDINRFLTVEPRTALTVPLMGHRVPCGFPSPADDYMDRPLDFNELLVTNPPATFSVVAAGDSMTGLGIQDGTLCIVDRSKSPASGCVVLALVGNEFTIKTYRLRGELVILEPANPAYRAQQIDPEIGFEVWGVITGAVTLFR